MKRVTIFTIFLLFLVNIVVVTAHETDDQMHMMEHMAENSVDYPLFMHYGPISFPVWTYYAEIVQHISMVVIALIAIVAIYLSLSKKVELRKQDLQLALWGFIILGAGELMTTLHHYLIHPFGIYNAVVNHLLLLVGLLLLALVFIQIYRR